MHTNKYGSRTYAKYHSEPLYSRSKRSIVKHFYFARHLPKIFFLNLILFSWLTRFQNFFFNQSIRIDFTNLLCVFGSRCQRSFCRKMSRFKVVGIWSLFGIKWKLLKKASFTKVLIFFFGWAGQISQLWKRNFNWIEFLWMTETKKKENTTF